MLTLDGKLWKGNATGRASYTSPHLREYCSVNTPTLRPLTLPLATDAQ